MWQCAYLHQFPLVTKNRNDKSRQKGDQRNYADENNFGSFFLFAHVFSSQAVCGPSGRAESNRLSSAAFEFQALPTKVGTAERWRGSVIVNLNAPVSQCRLFRTRSS